MPDALLVLALWFVMPFVLMAATLLGGAIAKRTRPSALTPVAELGRRAEQPQPAVVAHAA